MEVAQQEQKTWKEVVAQIVDHGNLWQSQVRFKKRQQRWARQQERERKERSDSSEDDQGQDTDRDDTEEDADEMEDDDDGEELSGDDNAGTRADPITVELTDDDDLSDQEVFEETREPSAHGQEQ